MGFVGKEFASLSVFFAKLSFVCAILSEAYSAVLSLASPGFWSGIDGIEVDEPSPHSMFIASRMFDFNSGGCMSTNFKKVHNNGFIILSFMASSTPPNILFFFVSLDFDLIFSLFLLSNYDSYFSNFECLCNFLRF